MRSEYKEDCYNYQEIQDMSAYIPTCKLEHELGACPCKSCDKFVSKEEIRNAVNEYLRKKYMPEQSSVKQEDVAEIMNRINDTLEEIGYVAVGYDNTDTWLMVIIDKI